MSIFATLSLFIIAKESSKPSLSSLIFLSRPVASPIAGSISVWLFTITLMRKFILGLEKYCRMFAIGAIHDLSPLNPILDPLSFNTPTTRYFPAPTEIILPMGSSLVSVNSFL